MRTILWNVYRQPLHHIIGYIVLLVTLWGHIGIKAKTKKLWKVVNGMVLLGIVIIILHMTIYSRSESSREIILTPFYTFIEAKSQSELYRTMLMNVFLFVPFGLAFPYILPKKMHPVMVTNILACALSATIEAVQYHYSLGLCEVDDVIMNTIGAAIGCLSFIIAEKLHKKLK